VRRDVAEVRSGHRDKRLTGARERRVVVLSEGSHCIGIEKNRMSLIREVQGFLEEPAE
jgi:hypothetical protein